MKKTILITGAGSGIGKDTAFTLAKRGHNVIATTETEEQSAALQKEAALNKTNITVFKLDITNAADRLKIEEHNLDVLISNAGIAESGSLAEIDMQRVRHNFEGPCLAL